MTSISIQLSQYEGSLELFLILAQKAEINLQDIEIKYLIQQIIPQLGLGIESLDRGADSLKHLGILLLLKSRKLLPESEFSLDIEEKDSIPLHYLQQIVEYCSFKELGKQLLAKQESALESFSRPRLHTAKVSPGIEHLSLEDLAKMFQIALTKASPAKEVIEEDSFKVVDFMEQIRRQLLEHHLIDFKTLFFESLTRMEIIVRFLALLELMKLGEVKVFKDLKTENICIKST